MLKISNPACESFNSLKCGEIFCLSTNLFNVSCCICGCLMRFEQFPNHFQEQHLSLAEQSIQLEELNKHSNISLDKESSNLNLFTIKEEEIAEDPCKEETERKNSVDTSFPTDEQNSLVDEIDDEEDNKSLQQRIYELQAKRNTRKAELSRKTGLQKELKRKTAVDPLPLSESEVLIKEILEDNEKLTEVIDNEIVTLETADISWSARDQYPGNSSASENDIADELPFPCLICKRSYRNKNSLHRHNYNMHNPDKPPVKKSKGPKVEHKCNVCNEVFRSARELGGHKWKHTGIVCDVCGKTFSQTGNLVLHKIRHTGIKAFKCKECSKAFFTAKELRSHMICHTGHMPVICEICGKRCRDGGVLSAHMRRHTGERPAKCEVCGKRFFSIHDLNVHAVTHSSERPFKCDICGSTFQRKKALRIHKRIHSKDRRHVCKICGKSFAQTGGLNSHMRSHDAAIEKVSKNVSAVMNSTDHIASSVFLNMENTNEQSELNEKMESEELVEHILGGE